MANLSILLLLAGSTQSWSMDHKRVYAKEVLLPPYHQGVLAKDSPLTDMRFTSKTTLVLTGQTTLWKWDLDTGKLIRLQLIDGKNENSPPLKRVGTDGLSDFVASDSRLFQVNWSPKRVLQYELDVQDRTLGFAGAGDNLWLIRTHNLVRFDRYTKSISSRFDFQLPESSKVVFDVTKQRLWYLDKREIRYVELATSEHTSLLCAKLKSDGLDLQIASNELLALSSTGVMRLSLDGKPIQYIPIEGRRKLRGMAISGSNHAYLFDDQNVEIYDVSSKTGSATKLPFSTTDKFVEMRVAQGHLALLVSGTPHVFSLSSEKPGDE